MPAVSDAKPLSKEWIEQQLAICKAEVDTRGHMSGIPDPYKYPVYLAFVSAAREGYPLVLKELQDFRASFALYSKAIRIGQKLYIEAHPEFIAEFGDLAEPDTGKMAAWLVEQVRRRPWAECPRCCTVCLEQDLVDGLCSECIKEAADGSAD